jgi:hypothetical protein
VGNEKEERIETAEVCPGEKIKIQIYSTIASSISNFDCGVMKRTSTGGALDKEQSSGRT